MNGEFLHIENIGKIKSAKIKLDGLSIITGKNDTGKSTIGKVIFSIVKAISRYKEDFQSLKEQEIFQLIEKLYFSLRKLSRSSNDFSNFRDLFFPPSFLKEVKHFLEGQISKSALDSILNNRYEYLNSFEGENKKVLLALLNKIENIILQNDDKKSQIISALSKAFVSEFHSELSPKNQSDISSLIEYYSVDKILEVSIKNNKIKDINLFDELLFKDVTYIESPIYLQLSNLIDNADTLFDFDINNERNLIRKRPKTSLHIKDLINKLEQSKYFSDDLFFENNELLLKISNIMNGSYVYDEKKSEFRFNKKDKNTIKAINTASGIKTFGMIQLLLQAEAINERTLLIIDEPENHLHPQWQVKYADVLTELIKNNISIIVNSHSPYMIQALNHFAIKKHIIDKTNFYLTKKTENEKMVSFENVSDDIDSIFRTLAEPLNSILW